MRTAAICPTCATYTNAVCVVYDGPYLATLDIAPLTDLEEIIQKINARFASIPGSIGYTPENVANKSTSTSLGTSNTLYPTQNAVKTYVDTAISSAPAHNLDQTLAAGNTATNKSLVIFTSLVGIDAGRITLDHVQSTVVVENLIVPGYTVNYNSFGIQFLTPGGLSTGLVGSTTGTGTNTLALPDTNSGTLALRVNGVAADAQGNISIPLTPYKKYVAKITQSGATAPTVDIVLENQFTNPVTFVYNGVGDYALNSLDIGSNPDKVVIFFQQGAGPSGITTQVPAGINSIGIFTWSNVTNALVNGAFTKAVIEVRVYP